MQDTYNTNYQKTNSMVCIMSKQHGDYRVRFVNQTRLE